VNIRVFTAPAVIDTNVLASGLLSPAGNEALIPLAIHNGLARPCFSEEILEEYPAVLARPKFAFPPHEIAAVLGGKQPHCVERFAEERDGGRSWCCGVATNS
jgi:PIN domain